jgi:S-DNA-T family DNA segregation ATPase FtsK/SpoIIIE
MYNHWTRTVRRSKLGVLLQPSPELDGEVLAVHVPRRAPVAMLRGRGYLVSGGELDLIQVAAPTAPQGDAAPTT